MTGPADDHGVRKLIAVGRYGTRRQETEKFQQKAAKVAKIFWRVSSDDGMCRWLSGLQVAAGQSGGVKGKWSNGVMNSLVIVSTKVASNSPGAATTQQARLIFNGLFSVMYQSYSVADLLELLRVQRDAIKLGRNGPRRSLTPFLFAMP